MKQTKFSELRAGTALAGIAAIAMFAAPAQAQNAPASTNAQAPAADEDPAAANDIVVTGSILRRTDRETPSPVTTLTAENMEQRGINTAAEALQRISANGSGTVSEGWNNGNNFAAGANAVSLRGLTVQKTLTLFDGLRMAPYPVADDGHRNFVDLNTIPDAIIDRIEVLKDGASSTYGADAVAGVVNVITKKQIIGLHGNFSGGITQEGDGAEYRADVSAGFGDLKEQGFNLYVSGSYRRNEVIWARDRDYPYNSGDLSHICDGAGHCMAQPARWYSFGVNADGSLGGSTVGLAPVVASVALSGVNTLTRTSEYQLLNNNCGAFSSSPVTLPNSARGLSATTGLYTYATNLCQQDMKAQYQTIRPLTERYGFSTRATVKVGDNAEAYVAGNYQYNHTFTQLTPGAFPSSTPPPSPITWAGVLLPVYVCSAGTATFAGPVASAVNVSSGCNAGNGVLNPNNPFAAAGQTALIRGRYDRPQTVETNTRALRGAAGIQGSFGGEQEWNYQAEFTASEVKLTRISQNYLIPQRLADKIATGEYNFVNPFANSQAVRDYVAPINSKTSTSNLWQIGGTLSRALFDLPGGPLQAAVGAQYRHEGINDQSANPENLAHPFDRYFTVNAVGAVGSRNVKSGFFELSAPVVEQVELTASGRYDDYSSGQSNFSPKFGAKFRPIKEVMLRGTWSQGFRIPSFNEAYGLPTTGYTNVAIDCKTYSAFCASHGNNTYATNQYSLGRTSTGNAALAPEKSTSWGVGAVFEPIRNLSFTIDYFNISVKDTIANISATDQNAALGAYLNTGNTTAVPGVVVVPGTPDPQFPTARALPAFIQFSFQNADQEKVQGIDFGAEFKHKFGEVQWYSSLDASYLINYSVVRKDGTVERYDGSLSPCDYTSCSGSPSWRGSWQNTLSYQDLSVTGTVYYTDGYDEAAVDYGGVPGDCNNPANVGAGIAVYKGGGPVRCTIGAQWNADLAFNYKVNKNFTFYANILNVLDIAPRFDPTAAYSIFMYNPAWGQPNIVGRSFRIGAKLDF